LQSILAARKVCDVADVRPNVYCIALAYSGSGKDWPRKFNVRALHALGMSSRYAETFASGEGIEDALQSSPALIFQTDEFDTLLQSINKAKDARYEGIIQKLLTLHTSANSVYVLRRKAGQDEPIAVDQPHVTILGTATPKNFWESLSSKMFEGGFLSRMMVVEAGKRPASQEPKVIKIPPRIMELGNWWKTFNPSGGNVDDVHPQPAIVGYTDEAAVILHDLRARYDADISKATDAGDNSTAAVWSRAAEHARRLALIYAVSESPRAPVITKAAIEWADTFANRQAARILWQAKAHIADNPFHGLCLRIKQRLGQAPGKALARSRLLRWLHVDAQALDKAIATLGQQGDIAIDDVPSGGRPITTYRLLRV
ncbi:MAG: DUF3987 domain-containing protein, partial [Acidobacteriales bacterium]|nr:DUF3987 domain-containing protein [Terriglobales bacterium]